ncbi:hypothetical protein BDV29DRAFT_158775 [Aspergillus leporis]|uniref:Myb-like DNA-binding domain-containing protein n=1 Tax=Aspergillus leporis TaxID=41062 RepID=A0A5N5WUI0_9EURO|nr:hypothetical protein BDV29DRAFT_158775 [Aspergillus leporis]
MPPKVKTDDHLVFLYLCLMNSGGVNTVSSSIISLPKQSRRTEVFSTQPHRHFINFNAVAEATNINISAARMRWTRLKARIEKEMANGTDDTKGEPSDTATPVPSPAKAASPKKRRGVKRKMISDAEDDGETEDDTANHSHPTMEAK